MTIKTILRRELEDYKVLLRNIPSIVVALFFLSVVAMNLLANKELFTTDWLALDCGFTLSWISFLLMDMICKRFGAKAAMKLSIAALAVNLCVCGIFWLLSLTPGHWGEYYSFLDSDPAVAQAANLALNRTIGGSWYVVLGSALAMLVSSAVNSLSNHLIAKHLQRNNYGSFALRSFVSTALAQFVDNLIFATVVSHIFFGWTWTQVLVCSLTGALMELLCEVVFSPLGYRMARQWEEEKVGQDYIDKKI
ncbi:MAG: VUT family protein [Candidatus Cryptobacteroides sp.]